MRACGQKLVKFCTLTHAAKLVVSIVSLHNYTNYNRRVTVIITEGVKHFTTCRVDVYHYA